MLGSDEPLAGIGHNKPSLTDILREEHAGLIVDVDDIAMRATAARADLGEGNRILTDKQRDALVGLGVEAGKLSKRIDPIRLASTEPLRNEVAERNQFFNALISRVDRIKTAFEEIIGVYDRAKRDEERRRAAEAARIAEEEASRKLAEAEQSAHSVVSDVILHEAVVADEKAKRLAAEATGAGNGPTRTEAGTISNSTPWTFAVDDWSSIDLNELRDQFTVAEIEKAIRSHVRKHKNTKPLKGVRFFQDEKTRFRG